MQDWVVVVALGALVLLASALAVALVRVRAHAARQAERARAETAALREELAAIERRLDRTTSTGASASFVITDLGHESPEPAPPAPARVDPALFADLVLRETVVKAASLAHGVRRALDAETRNRIRFEMRREVKRARKQRRADTRAARREWAERQRSAPLDEGSAA